MFHFLHRLCIILCRRYDMSETAPASRQRYGYGSKLGRGSLPLPWTYYPRASLQGNNAIVVLQHSGSLLTQR